MNIDNLPCTAHGLHHPDCPGVANVIHHIYRKKDPLPEGFDRNDPQFLRPVWNGPTTLGASGCHGKIHANQGLARELGLLAPRPVHSLTLTPLGFWLTSTGKPIQ